MQILNYKHSLQEEFRNLTNGQSDLFNTFDPQCAVIIGDSGKELDDQAKTKSFELYRHQFPSVTIIPYNELFQKTKKLVNLLENSIENVDIDDG